MELLATYDLTSENPNYNKGGSSANMKYISTDQIEMKEAENIQAIRLSIYPKNFLVKSLFFSKEVCYFLKFIA